MERHPLHDLKIAAKWGVIGAGLTYLFDPQLGRTRRTKLTDMGAARARRVVHRAGQRARHLTNVTKGKVYEVRHRQDDLLMQDDGLEWSGANGRHDHPLANI